MVYEPTDSPKAPWRVVAAFNSADCFRSCRRRRQFPLARRRADGRTEGRLRRRRRGSDQTPERGRSAASSTLTWQTTRRELGHPVMIRWGNKPSHTGGRRRGRIRIVLPITVAPRTHVPALSSPFPAAAQFFRPPRKALPSVRTPVSASAADSEYSDHQVL